MRIGFVMAAVVAIASLIGWPAPAVAQSDIIGRVKTVSGKAERVSGTDRLAIEVGTPIRRADTVTTGPDGAVGITFTDNSVFSLGPSSEFLVRDYVFNSTQFKGGSMRARLNRGTVAVASGDIARGSVDGMKMETPTAVLGVRGTRFLVRVGED